MRPGKPKKPCVEELLPLRLVGDFCSWQVEVPGLEFKQNASESLVGGKVLEFFLPLNLEEPVEFQIISSPLGFKVRLYPKEEVQLKEERKIGAAEANALVGGSGDGHGRNFIIDQIQAKVLLVRLALGKRGLEGPPLAAQVCYSLQLGNRPDLLAVTISAGRVTFSGEAAAAWSNDPHSLRLHQLLPLRLVGKPCSWRLEQSGLLLSFAVTEGEWHGYSLCLRLLTREVECQIVSDKMGFGWRLFPTGSSSKLPHSTNPVDSLPGQLGGKDDGSGCNFVLTGRPLSVVTLYVWLKIEDDRVQSIRVGQGAGSPEKQSPQVAIGARRVQYPVSAVMTPLGPELLEAAETEEQRQAALEQRNDMLRRASWRLQEEYDSEDVQQEVLALRQLYPYQQKKGLLALEMEGGKLMEQEAAEDSVQSYVRAMQEMKRGTRSDREVETHDESPEGTEDSNLAGTCEAKPEVQTPEDAPARSAEEELRQHCLRGLKAVQRQVAQHTESGENNGDGTLALLPQNLPSALAGALSMCELNSAWKIGHFSHWFGGPRAGRYMTSTLEDLWSWDFKYLFETVVLLQDQLRIILREMGEEGNHLSVEKQVMLSFHGRGQHLPPWEDGASRRSRRVSLVFHPSYSHRRASEGGALRLHTVKDKNQGKNMVEVPGGGANWAIFRTPDARQEVTKVNLPCGRWCITVCAEDAEVARKLRPDQGVLSCAGETTMESHAASREVSCDCCSFAAGDGVLLTCPGSHRICRNCLLMELRRESVPSCPACAGEGDRIQLASRWELMSQEHAALDDLGCCCTPGAEGCDSQIDVGSQVVIFGQSKASGLNGVRAKALWWDYESQIWEVILPSKRVLGLRTAELALCEACGGSNIYDCPSWKVGGRGLYPVSLGNRCCVKLGIDECSGDAHCPVGYPYFHGAEYLPFDSLLTSLDAVLFFLRHDFAHFFHYNDMIDVHPAGMDRIVFHNYRSWMHTFPHHHPQMDQGYYILTLPEEGLLYETSPNFRSFGSEPLMAPTPIGQHLLPFLVTDPKHQVVYVPPVNKWPTPSAWAMFTFAVESPIAKDEQDRTIMVQSEPGIVVMTNPHRQIAGSDFSLANSADGWTLSGQLEVVGGNMPSQGVRHQAVAWGGLSHYIYGVDEVQSLDFATGIDLAKWYFEASPQVFYRKELVTAYGGYLRFRFRSQYGNFYELNDPLDWVTIGCESCDTGQGARIIRFIDDTLRWIGNEVYVEFHLHENGRWSYDPLNSAAEFTYATQCQIAAILTNVSRIAILGDFTRGGEGIALDDVSIVAANASEQPTYPLTCQQGCICRHNPALLHPTCC